MDLVERPTIHAGGDKNGADIQLDKREYKLEYFHAKTQGDEFAGSERTAEHAPIGIVFHFLEQKRGP